MNTDADVLIVGGGPAGVVAALTAKKNNPGKKIALIRRDEKAVIPCGIPYIFGTLKTIEEDIMPDKLLHDNSINLIVDEAVSVDKEKKTVSTAGGKTLSYDKLVIATGSNPIKPPIKGIELPGVFFIKKDFKYLAKLKNALDKASSVVIVGGGFIGVEIADEVRKLGKDVAIVEMLPRLLYQAFDEEFCTQLEEKLKESGVNVYTNTKVEEILGENSVESLKLSIFSDRTLKADVVVVCVGAKPDIKLAENMGLEIGPRKGIVVDEYMRTIRKDTLAVGDCTEEKDFFTREVSTVMLASTATAEARIAGENLYKLKVIKQNKGTIGIFSTCVGGLVLGTAGLTESNAKKRVFDYVTGEHSTKDKHPERMPETKEIRVKLIFSRNSGVLLGGQVSGGISPGELINTIGLAIQNAMTITELITIQVGTHPMLTPAPTVYPLILAAEDALTKIEKGGA